jgi:hypothetical protein
VHFTVAGTVVTVHTFRTVAGQTLSFHNPLWNLFKSVLTKVLSDKGYSVSFTFTHLLHSSVKLQTGHRRPRGEPPRYIYMTMVDELVDDRRDREIWSDEICSRFMKHFK